MTAKPPASRRSFYSAWDEICYLYDKLLYWLYCREQAAMARAYASRLAKLLGRTEGSSEAILGQECWSLVYEAKGDLEMAITHRKEEIRLIRLWQRIAPRDSRGKKILHGRGPDNLCDRMDLLAILQRNSGHLAKAIQTLEKFKKLCRQHQIKFDGKDLLEDYLAERKSLTVQRRPA